MRRADLAFWSAAAAVVALFLACARAGGSEWAGAPPGELYYNALVRGFRAGHLYLEREVPPGLAALPDPYDPAANAPYRAAPHFLQDTSYFHGRLYLYFGITPALVLFWPWLALTGRFLEHRDAVAIFCGAGFLVSAGLWRALWRRHFPRVGAPVALAGVLALGLAASMPLMLMRPGICEVPIGCAYFFLMLALAGLWLCLHRPERGALWLTLASAAYGLAVGARPSDLFGAAILLVPVWRRRQEAGAARLLAAAVLPLAACGLGLLLYNGLRFGSPWDFGHDYQLSDIGRAPGFGLAYLGRNLRLYFLAPTYWSGRFPFAQGIRLPALPPGGYPPDGIFGLLPNIPFVLLAFLAPLGLRGRPAGEERALRDFLAAAALLCALILGPLLLYFAACGRYEAEFLPPLVLLAAAGVLALERAGAGRAWAAWRAGWAALLIFSIGFNLLASVGRYAGQRYAEGLALARAGRAPEAIDRFERSVAANPGFAPSRYFLGTALDSAGRISDAMGQYEASLRLDPRQPLARNNLAIDLARSRRLPEAAEQLEAAIQLKPDYVEARANLGNVYLLMGRLPQAAAQFEEAVRLAPGDPGLRARLAAIREAAR